MYVFFCVSKNVSVSCAYTQGKREQFSGFNRTLDAINNVFRKFSAFHDETGRLNVDGMNIISLMLGSVLVLMLPLLVWLTPDLRIKKSLLKCNWTIRKRLPRCKMRLKKRLLAFSRRLHARIRKTRYMHKMRCLLINRRSLLLALRLLWKTPIFP